MSIRKGIKNTVETGEDILTIAVFAGAAYLLYEGWKLAVPDKNRFADNLVGALTGDDDPRHQDRLAYGAAAAVETAAHQGVAGGLTGFGVDVIGDMITEQMNGTAPDRSFLDTLGLVTQYFEHDLLPESWADWIDDEVGADPLVRPGDPPVTPSTTTSTTTTQTPAPEKHWWEDIFD